jgi:hypothetical protein
MARAKKKPAAPKRKAAQAKSSPRRVVVQVSTRKGAWLFHGDPSRKSWKAEGPHFLGQTVNHMVLDPRGRKTILAAASTGHLGPRMFRSSDRGKTWKDSKRPTARAAASSTPSG